jgi:acetyl-CoA acetyltransferase
LINIENACASGGSALNLAFEAVAGGRAEVVLVVGAEQLNHKDRARPFNALRGSTDIEEIGESEPDAMASNSILMDYYAGEAQNFLDRYKASASDFALVAVKNRKHAAENPLAHLRAPQTVEEVLAARMIVSPLTLPMCSPITDGAAALIVCSEAYGRRLKGDLVELAASTVAAQGKGADRSPVIGASVAAYREAGVGPDDLDLIELHDAAAPAELLQYAEIGICEEGQAHHLLRSGATALGGKLPINVSGGLLSRGHPLGATGCAQVVELYLQLCGRAGKRQVENARIGLAINGGGWLAGMYALAVATIVKRID